MLARYVAIVIVAAVLAIIVSGGQDWDASPAVALGCGTAGDTNGDGVLDLDDATQGLMAIAGVGDPPLCAEQADTNCNGMNDAGDSLNIILYISGLPPRPVQGGCAPPGARGPLNFTSYLDLGPRYNGNVFNFGSATFVGGAGCGDGVQIVDLSDPANPVNLGTIADYPNTTAVNPEASFTTTPTFGGAIMAVGLEPGGCDEPGPPGRTGFDLWDVTNPADPQHISFTDIGGYGAHDVGFAGPPISPRVVLMSPLSEVVHPDHLGDVRIFDISDPDSPTEVGDWGIGKDANQAFGSPIFDELGPPFDCTPPTGGTAYCRGAAPGVFASSVSVDRAANTAYVSYWDAGTVVLNISNPASPFPVAHAIGNLTGDGDTGIAHPIPGQDHFIGLCHDFSPIADPPAGVPGWGHMHIFDSSTGFTPQEVATFTTENSESDRSDGVYAPSNISVASEDRAYLSWYSDGVRVVDISNPTNPTEVASYSSLGHQFFGINHRGTDGTVVASDRNSGLWVFRHTGP